MGSLVIILDDRAVPAEVLLALQHIEVETKWPRHFQMDFFLNENVWLSVRNQLMYVPKIPIDNNPALVWIMAWHRPGDKPLSEPMKLGHQCTSRLLSTNIRRHKTDFKFHHVSVYRKTSNIRRTLVRNKIVDHSDVVDTTPWGCLSI